MSLRTWLSRHLSGELRRPSVRQVVVRMLSRPRTWRVRILSFRVPTVVTARIWKLGENKSLFAVRCTPLLVAVTPNVIAPLALSKSDGLAMQLTTAFLSYPVPLIAEPEAGSLVPIRATLASLTYPVQPVVKPEAERFAAMSPTSDFLGYLVAQNTKPEAASLGAIRPTTASLSYSVVPIVKPEVERLTPSRPTRTSLTCTVPPIAGPKAEPLDAMRPTTASLPYPVAIIMNPEAERFAMIHPTVAAETYPIPQVLMSEIERLTAHDLGVPRFEQFRTLTDFQVKGDRWPRQPVCIPPVHALRMRFRQYGTSAEGLPEPLPLLAQVHNRVLRAVLRGTRILGEADDGEQAAQLLADGIRAVIERRGPARGSRFLWRDFPGAAAMFLVGTAIYGYRHGEYWDAVRQSVLLADISHRRFWGRAFLLFLATARASVSTLRTT